jgi:hypothetical protein
LDTELRNGRQIFTTGNDQISYLINIPLPGTEYLPPIEGRPSQTRRFAEPTRGQAADETHFNSGRVIMAAAASLISHTTHE